MEREHHTAPRVASRRADIAVGLIATLGIMSLCAVLATKLDHAAVLAKLGVEPSPSLKGGEHHDELKISFDILGATDMSYLASDSVELDDEMEVVGVEVGGEACCFVMANILPPEQSVLNARVGGKAVSLSYGDIEGRIRMFVADQDSPIALGVGGMDVEDRLVLLFDGKRYTQCSPAVPLQDIDYVRTTWSQWRDSHADTKVCVPGGHLYSDEYAGGDPYEDLSYEESAGDAEVL